MIIGFQSLNDNARLRILVISAALYIALGNAEGYLGEILRTPTKPIASDVKQKIEAINDLFNIVPIALVRPL